MKSKKVFELLDGINHLDSLIFEFDMQIKNEPVDFGEKKKIVKSIVMDKIKVKKIYFPLWTKIIALIAVFTLILTMVFSVQVFQFFNKIFYFVPSVGVVVDNNSTHAGYKVLEKQVQIKNKNGYLILKSAYIIDGKMVLNFTSTVGFLSNKKDIFLDKVHWQLQTQKSSFSPIGNSEQGGWVQGKDVIHSKLTYAVSQKSENVIYKIYFLKLKKEISFAMVSSDKVSNFIEKEVDSNGINMKFFIKKYQDEINVDVFTKNRKGEFFDTSNYKCKMEMVDSKNKKYLSSKITIDYDTYMDNRNEVNRDLLNKEMYNPGYHCTFNVGDHLNFPISFKLGEIRLSYEASNWIDIRLPKVGETNVSNINTELKGVPIRITEVKRISEKYIQLCIKNPVQDNKKVFFFVAGTYYKYTQRSKILRGREWYSNPKDGSLNKWKIEIDPKLSVAKVYLGNPTISYFGNWKIDVKGADLKNCGFAGPPIQNSDEL